MISGLRSDDALDLNGQPVLTFLPSAYHGRRFRLYAGLLSLRSKTYDDTIRVTSQKGVRRLFHCMCTLGVVGDMHLLHCMYYASVYLFSLGGVCCNRPAASLVVCRDALLPVFTAVLPCFDSRWLVCLS
jgi:hypothetical protein